jgi:hypothetical protein
MTAPETRCILVQCAVFEATLATASPQPTHPPTPTSSSSQIVTVHIPTGIVTELLYPPSAIEILMVDPSSDLLLSWSANSYYAAQLQQINSTTGQTSPVFTASYDLSANGGKLHTRTPRLLLAACDAQ